MKKRGLILFFLIAGLVSGCSLFDSPLSRPDFKVHFKTEKDIYYIDSARTGQRGDILATFANQSNQPLYLIYKGCLPEGLEMRHGTEWETVVIPIFCAAVVRGPVRVNPGETKSFGVNLDWFSQIETGTYRLVLAVTRSDKKEPVKVFSNLFDISY